MSPPRSPAPRLAPTRASRVLAWLRGRPLARDIAVILCLKLILLLGLKYAFFDRPLAQHMRVPSAMVAHQILDTPLPSPSLRGDPDAR